MQAQINGLGKQLREKDQMIEQLELLLRQKEREETDLKMQEQERKFENEN